MGKLPSLDARLMAAYELAGECASMADIGADHGRLAAALIAGGRAGKALISDISPKALEKARGLIAFAGLSDRAEFVVADGLDALRGTLLECQTVCVMGMGGDAIAGILTRGRECLGNRRLVLGPQTRVRLVRETLSALGYAIVKERIVKDGGRYYAIIMAAPGSGEPLSERELILGPRLIDERPPLWREYLARRRRILGAEISAMKSAVRQDNSDRLAASEREMRYVTGELEREQPFIRKGMRAITVRDVYDWLDEIAPFDTAESFDNVGLLIGGMDRRVNSVMFCVDPTADAAREAARLGCELVVSHHPIMFSGIKSISYDEAEGCAIAGLISSGICLIASHTCMDKAEGGIADALAEALGLTGAVSIGEYIRAGELPRRMSALELEGYISAALGARARGFYTNGAALISRVAVAPGAYGEGVELLRGAGAQAFIVGEIRHHHILTANHLGIAVYDAEHFATEFCGVEALYRRFQAHCESRGASVQAHLYKRAPYQGAAL